MDFDWGMLKEGLTTLATAVGIYKQIRDSLPEGSKKQEISEALQKAERQLKLAESQIAQGLKYEFCRNHFPPQIMLSRNDQHWKCPQCDNEKYTGAAGISVEPVYGLTRRSRWSL
jgi:hypothetical protein